jgi:hypothetical protein
LEIAPTGHDAWIAALLNIDYTVVIHADRCVVLRLAIYSASPTASAVFKVHPQCELELVPIGFWR